MGETNIEWANKVWNPIAGCAVVSPGCTNCYAMKMAHRIEGMNKALGRENHYAGLTKKTKAGAVWTGKVATAPDSIFLAPLRWKKPARVFVNSMADLFHEDVADATIDRAFAVMALCPHLTFMVLTKRSGRMRAYINGNYGVRLGGELMRSARGNAGSESAVIDIVHRITVQGQPLRNVWLGCSVEDRERKHRIDDLRATPAAVRFLSCEPLLEDLGELDLTAISLAIIGGESGSRSRPFMLSWAAKVIGQCRRAGVAAFVKQVGAEAYDDRSYRGHAPRYPTRDRKGGDPAEWPADLRVRELPT